MKYFAKYFPVEGEIKEGELWQKAVDSTDGYCGFNNHSHDCGCGNYVEGYKQALKDLL